MFKLGEIQGEVRALRESSAAAQTAQSQDSAENKREHEEFRNKIGLHDAALAVLNDNKQSSASSRADFWTRVGVGAAVLGVLTTTVLTIIWH